MGVQPARPFVPARSGQGARFAAQLGWTPGPDGIVRKNGESPVLVMVSNNSNATLQADGRASAADARSGIDAEIKFYPGDVLFAPAGMGGILQLGRFDLSVAGWYSGIDPTTARSSCAKIFRRAGTTTALLQ